MLNERNRGGRNESLYKPGKRCVGKSASRKTNTNDEPPTSTPHDETIGYTDYRAIFLNTPFTNIFDSDHFLLLVFWEMPDVTLFVWFACNLARVAVMSLVETLVLDNVLYFDFTSRSIRFYLLSLTQDSLEARSQFTSMSLRLQLDLTSTSLAFQSDLNSICIRCHVLGLSGGGSALGNLKQWSVFGFNVYFAFFFKMAPGDTRWETRVF